MTATDSQSTNEADVTGNVLRRVTKYAEADRLKNPHLYRSERSGIETTEIRGKKFVGPTAVVEELARTEAFLKQNLREGEDPDTTDYKILSRTVAVPDPNDPNKLINKPLGEIQDEVRAYKKFLEEKGIQVMAGKVATKTE